MARVMRSRIEATIIVAMLCAGAAPVLADDLRQDLRQNLRLDLRQDLRAAPQPQTTNRKATTPSRKDVRGKGQQSADRSGLSAARTGKDAKRGLH